MAKLQSAADDFFRLRQRYWAEDEARRLRKEEGSMGNRVDLGDTVKCKVTGVTGIAIGKTQFAYSTARVCVQRRELSAQVVGDEMLWKGEWGHQLGFARDKLGGLLSVGLYGKERDRIATVISWHRSKSIILPVYSFFRPDLGLWAVLRNNFYDWKLSIVSETPITADFTGLFHTTPPLEPDYTGNELSSVYFEGFPEEFVYGYLSESDGRKWSAAVGGDNEIWTTLFLIMRQLGAIKPVVWHTRESHRKALDEDSKRWRAEWEAEKTEAAK